MLSGEELSAPFEQELEQERIALEASNWHLESTGFLNDGEDLTLSVNVDELEVGSETGTIEVPDNVCKIKLPFIGAVIFHLLDRERLSQTIPLGWGCGMDDRVALKGEQNAAGQASTWVNTIKEEAGEMPLTWHAEDGVRIEVDDD